MMDVRVAGNAGTFYPAQPKEIEKLITFFNNLLKDAKNIQDKLALIPQAIISPHAGYIYSGFTANIAHKLLVKNKELKRIVVIGPSHHIYFERVSGSFFKEYQTPLKNLPIDLEYLALMKKLFNLTFIPRVHELEHSTETQLPFIAHYNNDIKVIELIYGKTSYLEVAKIVKWLLEDKLTGVVISTDLSHFYNLERAQMLDAICLEGVAKEDNDIIDLGCEACGIVGMKAIIKSAKELGFKSEVLDYRTSADVTGDKQRVVGYMSAAFYK